MGSKYFAAGQQTKYVAEKVTAQNQIIAWLGSKSYIGTIWKSLFSITHSKESAMSVYKGTYTEPDDKRGNYTVWCDERYCTLYTRVCTTRCYLALSSSLFKENKIEQSCIFCVIESYMWVYAKRIEQTIRRRTHLWIPVAYTYHMYLYIYTYNSKYRVE